MIDPLRGSLGANIDNFIEYYNEGPIKEDIEDITKSNPAKFSIDRMDKLMHRNLIFDNRSDAWYSNYNRYGWINLSDNDQVCKEYLFFTKPDLYIFKNRNIADGLNDTFDKIPFFKDAYNRNPLSLAELQYSVQNKDGSEDPFMHLLSNYVTSKMDLPAIQADSNKSTENDYGVSIDYRSHSFKSDYAYDFALSFKDNQRLDVYILLKAYDEYMRMLKMGEINFGSGTDTTNGDLMKENFKNYIKNKIIPEQFSIYKFLVGSDGETILYYAKATGVYFTDVPRADFGDPGNDGFKFSVSFHANFVQDMDPLILSEFDTLTPASYNYNDFLEVHDGNDMDNEPAKYARIIQVTNDKRVRRRTGTYDRFHDYRLKWTNARKSITDTQRAASTMSKANPNGYVSTAQLRGV